MKNGGTPPAGNTMRWSPQHPSLHLSSLQSPHSKRSAGHDATTSAITCSCPTGFTSGGTGSGTGVVCYQGLLASPPWALLQERFPMGIQPLFRNNGNRVLTVLISQLERSRQPISECHAGSGGDDGRSHVFWSCSSSQTTCQATPKQPIHTCMGPE